jgi:hypothetical protein
MIPAFGGQPNVAGLQQNSSEVATRIEGSIVAVWNQTGALTFG